MTTTEKIDKFIGWLTLLDHSDYDALLSKRDDINCAVSITLDRLKAEKEQVVELAFLSRLRDGVAVGRSFGAVVLSATDLEQAIAWGLVDDHCRLTKEGNRRLNANPSPLVVSTP